MTRSNSLVIKALSFLVMAAATAPAVLADDSGKLTAASPDKSAAPTGTGTSSAAPSEKSILKNQELQLRQMGEAVKRLKRAALDLIGECTQPMEMMGEIDIIGTDVIPIMPMTAEGFGTQYLPPRPKYINLHMQQLGGVIPVLQDDLDSLTIPDDEKEAAAPILKDINGLMADVRSQYKTLQGLTATTDYSSIKITSAARAIHSVAGDIDKSRKKLLKEDKTLEKQNK